MKHLFVDHPDIGSLSVPQYLGTLAASAATTKNVVEYAKLIVKLAERRKLSIILQDATEDVSKVDDAADVIARLSRELHGFGSCSSIALKSYALLDLMQLNLPPRDWVLADLLKIGDLMMVYAARGIGKTWLVLELGICLSLGRGFLKWQPPRPFRVFHICGEMHVDTIRERIKSLLPPNSPEDAESRFRVLSATAQERGIPDLSTREGQAAVERELGDAEVVVLDNLSTLFRTKENEADDWQAAQEWLIRLRSQGRTVILVHHAGKNGGQRGTSRREDVLDLVWSLEADPDSDKSEGAQFTIKFKKNRGLTGDNVRDLPVRLASENGILRWSLGGMAPPDPRLSEVLTLHKKGLSLRDISEATKVPLSTVQRWTKKHSSSTDPSHETDSLESETVGQDQSTS